MAEKEEDLRERRKRSRKMYEMKRRHETGRKKDIDIEERKEDRRR